MRSSPLPLLHLQHASAVQLGGLPPSCLITVRLLDHLDLVIRGGECVVIRHTASPAAEVLHHWLAGEGARGAIQRLAGIRQLQRGVRVRRTSIPHSAVAPLVVEWETTRDHTPRDRRYPTTPPVLHILRALPRAHIASGDTIRHPDLDWAQWGRQLRATGGAVVILAENAPISTPDLPHAPRRVRESGGGEWPARGTVSRPRHAGVTTTGVRRLMLHQGRLLPAHP